jgi:hypothetical protein
VARACATGSAISPHRREPLQHIVPRHQHLLACQHIAQQQVPVLRQLPGQACGRLPLVGGFAQRAQQACRQRLHRHEYGRTHRKLH